MVRGYLELGWQHEQFGVPNPLSSGFGETVRSLSETLEPLLAMSGIVSLAISLAVMTPRWRRAGGLPRWQLAAFVVPFTVWVIALRISYHLQLEGWPRLGLLGGSALGWAGAVAYGFTRDRIWAIDRPARHLLTAFILVTGVILVYGGAVGAATATSRDARGAGAALLVCLTFAVGTALRPTALWCTRAVDRLYYGERSRPYQLARDLAERLSRTVRPQDAPALLCATAVDNLRLPGARLLVPTQNGPRQLAAAGRPADPDCPEEEFELVYDGAIIGCLRVRPRDAAAALDGQDREVLRFLSDQAAPAVASLRLYEDLRAGREQILTARETERWRLRRDIHVILTADEAVLQVEIRDDGTGITPRQPPTGVGLQSMAERATELGGTIDISSSTKGTIVRAGLPRTPPLRDGG
ncbi:ATP-binding protein [Actinomadura macra]|uniref:ATP-binding protein n=1 Tax=Actinomadura macra TaxID=46164 RepID=UPI00083247F0|nr:ATP-binding protein [Actinomadura macra]